MKKIFETFKEVNEKKKLKSWKSISPTKLVELYLEYTTSDIPYDIEEYDIIYFLRDLVEDYNIKDKITKKQARSYAIAFNNKFETDAVDEEWLLSEDIYETLSESIEVINEELETLKKKVLDFAEKKGKTT